MEINTNGKDSDRISEEEYSRLNQYANDGANKGINTVAHAPGNTITGANNMRERVEGLKRAKGNLQHTPQPVKPVGEIPPKSPNVNTQQFNRIRNQISKTKKAEQVARGGNKAARKASKIARKIGKALKKAIKVAIEAIKTVVKKITEFVVTHPITSLLILAILLFIILLSLAISDTETKKEEKRAKRGNYTVANTAQNRYDNGVTTYSPQNAALKAYYEIQERNTLYQIDMNDSKKLIPYVSEEYEKDYFDREKELLVNANMLYALDYFMFQQLRSYPEQFIKPVAYDKDNMVLAKLVDNRNSVIVESHIIDTATGKSTEEKCNALYDYGFGTVASYKKLKKVKTLEGEYTDIEEWDSTQNKVVKKKLETPEKFNIELENEEVTVLDKAVTFYANITYKYKEEKNITTKCSEGDTSDEKSPKLRYCYKVIDVPVYTAEIEGKSLEGDKDYLISKGAAEEQIKAKTDADGNAVVNKISLYKYRNPENSGIYTMEPKEDGEDKENLGTEYFDDYINHFSVYVPVKARLYADLDKLQTEYSVSEYDSSNSSSNVSNTVNSSGEARSLSPSREKYFKELVQAAQADMAESGILASITIAQNILESGWGEKAVGNNYYGIKAGGSWDGPTVDILTHEEVNGVKIAMVCKFRAYDSMIDSIRDHSRLIWNSGRYTAAIGEKDYVKAITAIREGGYATSSSYIKNVCDVIESRNLTQYDTAVWDGSTPEYAKGNTSNNTSGGSSGSTGNSSSGGISGISSEEYINMLPESEKEIFNNFVDCYKDSEEMYKLYEYTPSIKVRENILVYTYAFKSQVTMSEAKKYVKKNSSSFDFEELGAAGASETDNSGDSSRLNGSVADKDIKGIVNGTKLDPTKYNTPELVKLAEFFNEWQGTLYLYGGDSKNGIDCSHFVYRALRDSGYYSFNGYHTADMMYKTTGKQNVKEEDAVPGDLIFETDNGSTATHVGIYMGDGCMIESGGKGVQIRNNVFNGSYYKAHKLGIAHLK